MRDLIDSLWEELRTLVCEVLDLRARGKSVRPLDQRQLHVLGWALIVLQADPPAGDPAAVGAYLGELLDHERPEIKTQILGLFRVLAVTARGF
jgi:hypothetical protein